MICNTPSEMKRLQWTAQRSGRKEGNSYGCVDPKFFALVSYLKHDIEHSGDPTIDRIGFRSF